MQEARIFHRDALVRAVRIAHLERLDERPHARLRLRAAVRMIAHAYAARHLPVNHVAVAFNLLNQVHQHLLHLILGHRDIDVNQLRAGEDAINVVIKMHRHMIERRSCIVHAIAKVARAVVHRHHHLFNRTDFSIVVRNILHCCRPLFYMSGIIRYASA